MSDKKLIFIVGKTSSGKDTVANYITKKYKIPQVISYCTRPMRDYEEDGVQHYFIREGLMAQIASNDSVIAYTKFPNTGYEYCATRNCIMGEVAVYIIDAHGVHWFQEHYKGAKIDYCSIYVDLDEKSIVSRAVKRGDSVRNIETRLASEREQFDTFKKNMEYDYLIRNDGTKEELFEAVDSIMTALGYSRKV